MKRLFIVNYQEKKRPKHQCIEMEVCSVMSNAEVITKIRCMIGIRNELDSVIEVCADMNAQELNDLYMQFVSEFPTIRALYLNVAEPVRVAALEDLLI